MERAINKYNCKINLICNGFDGGRVEGVVVAGRLRGEKNRPVHGRYPACRLPVCRTAGCAAGWFWGCLSLRRHPPSCEQMQLGLDRGLRDSLSLPSALRWVRS